MAKQNRLYHSALVKSGPTWLSLTGPVKSGQYGYFVEVVNGDGEVLSLNAETETIGKQLQQLKQDVWYQFTAKGSKEKATMEIVDMDGVVYDPPSRSGPPREALPTPKTSAPRGGGAPPARQDAPSLHKIMRACLAVAHDLEAAYEAHYKAPMTENARTMAISLAIEINRRGGDLSTLTEG